MGRAGFGDRVEGVHAVAAALAAGRVRELIVERRHLDSGPVADLVSSRSDLPVTVVDDVRPLAGTSAPQGVVAVCRARPFTDLDDLAEPSPAALVAVDHIEDPHNLGAIVRSAVAAGMTGVIVPERRNAPVGAAAFKAAAGALETIRLAQVGSLASALRRLSDRGVWSVGLDASGDRSLFGLDLLSEPVVVVVGGETGLGKLVHERVDVVASIPMAAGTESLNASVAAALACFEVMRIRTGV